VNEYRIYVLDRDGHVTGPSKIVAFKTDEEALAHARQFLDGNTVEVWLGPRLAGRLNSDKP
jgi:hypothetical protein